MKSEETIGAGGSWSGIVRRGQTLTITDLEGMQGVDFLCYSQENPEERYHAANTIKKASTLRLTKGHVLYSDIARPMMTIVEDTADGTTQSPAAAALQVIKCSMEQKVRQGAAKTS